MQVPLDSLDLSLVSILYTSGEHGASHLPWLPCVSSRKPDAGGAGDMAAITPSNFNYNFTILHNTITVSSWRELLYWLGPPGAPLRSRARIWAA